MVRVVEGPLFSEVVAHYQHFQQTIRIHNVPGTKNTQRNQFKWLFARSFLCLVKGTRWYNTTRANMFDKIYNLIFPVSCLFFNFKFADWYIFRFTSLCGLSVVLYGFVFSGVDGLSIDITTMVDIRDQTNKELAMRLVTDIQSGEVFYTDLNGFQVSPTLGNREE